MRTILSSMNGSAPRKTARAAAKKLLAAFLLALVASAPAHAHALRCGHRVIARGDHADKLLRYCGEPTAVQSRWAQRTLHANIGGVLIPGFVEDVLIEEWTYNFGPYRLMGLVRMENGVVAEIEHLGYGYTPK
ncbi:MAG TPA: DUF2845 domain-containing protein [Gammaproteobacteria bacterium]